MARGRPKRVVSIVSENGDVELKEANAEVGVVEVTAEFIEAANLEVEQVEAEVEQEEEIVAPKMFSPEWSDYVLAQLQGDEKSDDKPTVEGLRRVAQVLLGPILNSAPTHVVANGSQTLVGYAITFLWNRGDDPRYGQEVTFGSCADTTDENASHPFNKYLGAMADTRAEGRALKKALGLRRIMTAEEANVELQVPSKDTVSAGQLAAIKNLCRKQDINVKKFIEMFCTEIGVDVPVAVEQLTKDVAVQACQRLNDFNVDVKNSDYKIVPSEIKGFE